MATETASQSSQKAKVLKLWKEKEQANNKGDKTLARSLRRQLRDLDYKKFIKVGTVKAEKKSDVKSASKSKINGKAKAVAVEEDDTEDDSDDDDNES